MKLSFCLPYYKNPQMLAEQFRVWSAYGDEVKRQIEIVLVDDASPAPAMDVARPAGLPPIRIYRVLEDIPWHQHGARNLAASVAEGEWLLLTDMDHVVPGKSLGRLLGVLETANPAAVFTFHRLDAPTLKPTLNDRGELKPHVNTFVLRRAKFWAVGGYDEDCVGYGTDSYFRKRLWKQGPATHLRKVPVIRYPREVIADASGSQPGMDPKAFRDAGRRSAETKARMQKKEKIGAPPTVLAFSWERVL